VLLLLAGHETTANLIGNGTLALLRHPDQLTRLRDDPALDRVAVEELLRYDSPVQYDGRTALEDVELAGVTVRAGEAAIVSFGAANRDPAVFDEPDRLDLERADLHHLAFGVGIHYCLGAALARLEGQLAIPRLVRRFPNLAVTVDAPEWREHVVLRGLTTLPVSF
jgi:cytochrome P450